MIFSAVSCSALKPIPNGQINPSKCSKSKSNFNDECSYECNPGFTLTGPRERKCVDFGVWSEVDIQTSCVGKFILYNIL